MIIHIVVYLNKIVKYIEKNPHLLCVDYTIGYADLELEIKRLDAQLETNHDLVVKDPNFFTTYQNKKNRLHQYEQEWEDIALKVERLDT